MNRKDGGFVGSHASRTCEEESAGADQSHTSPHARHKSRTTSTHTLPPSTPEDMDAPACASGTRSKPVRHTSTTSSGNSSSKSKGYGYSSKPSSRRTSCTIVDPSRPARHYRIKSSHSVSVAASREVEDVLALHFRSYSLFTNPSYHAHSALPSPTLPPPPSCTNPASPTPLDSDDMHTMQDSPPSEHDEKSIADVEPTNVTMHWTSPCSRKREYERIDRANSGFRGLFRKLIPRSISGPQERFYEKDEPDDSSVRRYRLESIHDSTLTEKIAMRHQAHRLATPGKTQRKTSWACF